MTFSTAANTFYNNREARTANGMKTNATTSSAVLDLFGKIGSSRGKNLVADFTAAMIENEELAIRTLLWSRDIRNGAGERKTFRDLLTELDTQAPEIAARIMHKVPELGRWDDLFSYVNNENRSAAYAMIKEALYDSNGLCAKWMPRKGKIAVELTKFLGLTPKQYRRLVVDTTNVVETAMCAKQWDTINFSHVPSVASSRYQKAFGRNASEAYGKYLKELQKPESERTTPVKINAGAIYPYDIVKAVSNGNEAVANEQWKALPNYIGNSKIFAIVDTSGSMGVFPGKRNYYGMYASNAGPSPIEVAISLGLYVSEKNTSDFKDLLMIFDTMPKLCIAKGTLSQRIKQLPEIVSGSTNLNAAFDMLLAVAVKGNVSAEDMPETLLILSDMQFSQCVKFDDSAQEMIKRKYEKAGYEVPKVVFWNLSPYGDTNVPVKYNDKGVCLVSGFSPSIMQTVLSSDLEDYTPYNVMIKTLTNDRYNY